jgi:hypothetical protein
MSLPEVGLHAVVFHLQGARTLLLLSVATLFSSIDLHAIICSMGAQPCGPIWPSHLPPNYLQPPLLPCRTSLLPLTNHSRLLASHSHLWLGYSHSWLAAATL